MLFFKINIINGTNEDAEVLKECLVDWDGCFEDYDPSLEVEVEELYDHNDEVDEMVELAIEIANALSDSEFFITGCIDTSEDAGEYMDFVIEYKEEEFVSRYSDWYVYMHADDFDDYDDFANYYQDEDGNPRFSEEQYNEFKDGVWYILESGNGDCVSEVPLTNKDEYEFI